MWQFKSISLVLFWATTSYGRLVNTQKGPVDGNRVDTLDPRTQLPISYDEFLTIPFAEPPVGQNRFAPPKPAQPWKDLNSSVPYQRVCYQVGNLFGLVSDFDSAEDCLYLNVYVPAGAGPEPLPVMIWITGGAFLVGGGIWYGPNFLMAHQIILVTINYRVGPFGYLTLGEDEAPGNVGMLDQRMAMEWVRDNIDRFGGDPDQVTLAGESAGSYSATYHLVSPGSKGLFNRVIAQSGVGGLSPGFHHWSPAQGVRLGTEVATLLGCISLTVQARLECLRGVSAVALSLVEYEDGVISQPVVDGTYASDPFLPNYPDLAFKNGDFNVDVDVLMGSNRDEGYLFTQAFLTLNNTLFPLFMDNWDKWGPILVLQKHFLETSDEDVALAFEILEHYCGTRDVTMDHLANITDMFTDSFFWVGVDKYVDFHLQYSNRNVFQYINDHLNDISQSTWAGVKVLPGVSHADELWIEWGPLLGLNRTLSEEDIQASLHLTELWTNFVKYGDPTPPGLESSNDQVWVPVSTDDKRYLKLGSTISMESRSENYLDRMQFWRNLFP